MNKQKGDATTTHLAMQTTNLLLQAGEEALTAHPGSVASLSPLR